MIGKQFGLYVIESELGAGGMGTVYKARQTDLGRLVALKVLSSDFTNDASFVKRFLREARAVAQLNHDHIVHIYDCGQQDGTYYYAMELVDGEGLDYMIARKGRLTWKRAAHVTLHVCRALQAAHAAGIIHRDIKPANIILNRDNKAKVMDFGIALDLDAERLTHAGTIMGTPEYMSPEQIAGITATPQADIYSLGVVLYEMLTGRVPFENENRMITLQQHKTAVPQSPRELVPDIPEPVERMALKMLAKDPADRYPSCTAIVADLRALVHALAGEASATDAALGRVRTMAPPAAPPPRRSRLTMQRTLVRASSVVQEAWAAGVEVVRPYRIPLAAFVLLGVGASVYQARTACSKPLVKVATLEPSPVETNIVLSYMIEMYTKQCECFQQKYRAAPGGALMTVRLAGGQLLTGVDGRWEGDAVLLYVPKVRGIVRLPAEAVQAGTLQPFSPAAFNKEAESWVRRYYMDWKRANPSRGGTLSGEGMPSSALSRMLLDAQRDLPPPPEVLCRAELRRVAKRWAALESARAAGKDTGPAQTAYGAVVEEFLARLSAA